MIGARLGPYQIVEKIGAGGMGEVYRAQDTRLHRSVAIKVLPQSFAADPDRMARFEREARVLASLNHAHIAHVYGLETQDARSFIVMELVGGGTLAEWIARQPRSAPPIEEIVSIARQIAEALEAAHEQGIVHRDLKPANIKVTDDGTIKVLDFGLARAPRAVPDDHEHRPELTESPTMSTPADLTHAGVVLGTAAYMSPEQAKGKQVDKRADIWAFGCVLFEMLTARPAYRGETLTETLAAVMRDRPPLDALPRATPNSLRTLLARCLEPDPRRRLRDIGEARVVLEPSIDRLAPEGHAAAPRSGWQTLLPWLVTAAAVVALTAVLARGRTSVAPPLSRTVIPLGQATFDISRPTLALSPDGERLAYVAQEDQTTAIYLRGIDSFDAVRLPGTETVRSLFFSPDGEWVGFEAAAGRLKKVSTRGGPPITLAALTDYSGATWTRAGSIIAANSGPNLFAVTEDGGEPRIIPPVAGTTSEKTTPHALPDGQTILYTVGSMGTPSAIAARRLDANTEKILVNEATQPVYFDGHLIFSRGGTLFAARFDAAALELQDTPVPVLEGVLFNAAFQTTQYAMAGNGRLAFMPAAPTRARQLALLDRGGAVSAIGGIRGGLYIPRVAPDGRRIALTIQHEDNYSISIVDVASGSVSELVASGMAPVWSPDGTRIAYAAVSRDGGLSLHVVPVDRSSPPATILADGSSNMTTSWSPDGRSIAFTRVVQGSTTGEDIFLIAPDGSNVRPAVQMPGVQHGGTFSPDGKWLAYVHFDAGSVFVADATNLTRRWRVDVDGGSSPGWSADSRELFFMAGQQRDQLTSVRVSVTNGVVGFARPVRLLTAGIGTSIGFGIRRYDVMPDGKHFVIVTADAPPPPEIRVLLDFGSRLAALGPH